MRFIRSTLSLDEVCGPGKGVHHRAFLERDDGDVQRTATGQLRSGRDVLLKAPQWVGKTELINEVIRHEGFEVLRIRPPRTAAIEDAADRLLRQILGDLGAWGPAQE